MQLFQSNRRNDPVDALAKGGVVRPNRWPSSLLFACFCLFRRATLAALVVLVASAPKIIRVLYIASHLHAFGIPPPQSVASLGTFVSRNFHVDVDSLATFSPTVVLGGILFWRAWTGRRRRRWPSMFAIFTALFVFLLTATVSAQLDSFAFHDSSAHAFAAGDDCALIGDFLFRNNLHFYFPFDTLGGFFRDAVSTAGVTASGLLGLDCTTSRGGAAVVYPFRRESSRLAADAALSWTASSSSEWFDLFAFTATVALAIALARIIARTFAGAVASRFTWTRKKKKSSTLRNRPSKRRCLWLSTKQRAPLEGEAVS